MKFLGFTIIIIYVFLLAHIIRAIEEISQSSNMTCSNARSIMLRRQIQGIVSCTKSMKFKNEKDRAAKMMCVLKCVMKNEGMLNDEWKMTKGQFEKFITTELHPIIQRRGAPLFLICMKAYGDTFEPAEEMCHSYYSFAVCFVRAMIQMCVYEDRSSNVT